MDTKENTTVTTFVNLIACLQYVLLIKLPALCNYQPNQMDNLLFCGYNFLRIQSHLLKKFLKENFIFCAVFVNPHIKEICDYKSGNRLSSSGNPATTIDLRPQTLGQLFSCEFCEITKNTFSYRTPPAAAYAHNKKGKVLNRSTEKQGKDI